MILGIAGVGVLKLICSGLKNVFLACSAGLGTYRILSDKDVSGNKLENWRYASNKTNYAKQE